MRKWLDVLVNSFNLGFFGKVGRFFAIGPREFGMHPTNRIFRLFNSTAIHMLGTLLHSAPFFRGLTQTGYTHISPYRYMAPLAYLIAAAIIYYPMSAQFWGGERLDQVTLEDVRKLSDNVGLPEATMNFRTSAHYLEINSIYSAEMARRVNSNLHSLLT